MKEQEKREPVSLPGKPSSPVTEKERREEEVNDQPVRTENTGSDGENGSIPLDHDETIGIP